MDRGNQIKLTGRLLSIDALRGFDMLWIIGGSQVVTGFSKAAGIGYPGIEATFDHAWGQFHFYDLIMPLFLFIVGVVMPVSFSRRSVRGENKKSIYLHVLKRVVILYLLGLAASGNLLTFDKDRIHLWTDTLHAIAAGYLVSSVLILETGKKFQVIITFFLLMAYWLILAFVPVPGHGAGIYKPELNLPLYIDNAVLGHWQEGLGWTYIITNMTFTCSVMLGVFAGQLLMSEQSPVKKTLILSFIGISCVAAGLVWGIWFPIIHHLWTSSLVLFAGGLSYLLLALFYFVIDVKGYRKWSFFFAVIGMNAIAVYVATHLFDFTRIGNVFVGGLLRWAGPWSDFIQAAAALAVVWLILYWMYIKETFLKI